MNREEKLEAAVRAGMRLRAAIEALPKPPLLVRALLIPVEAVREYDQRMEELKNA